MTPGKYTGCTPTPGPGWKPGEAGYEPTNMESNSKIADEPQLRPAEDELRNLLRDEYVLKAPRKAQRPQPNEIELEDVLGSIDVDFGYAVGNLNMDTTRESRADIIAKLLAWRDNHKPTLADVASPNPSPEASSAIESAVERAAEAQAGVSQRLPDDEELPSIPMVNGLDCPACGHPTLILGDGGYITCSYISCPNPDYSEAIEESIARKVLEAENRLLDVIQSETYEGKLTSTIIEEHRNRLKETK